MSPSVYVFVGGFIVLISIGYFIPILIYGQLKKRKVLWKRKHNTFVVTSTRPVPVDGTPHPVSLNRQFLLPESRVVISQKVGLFKIKTDVWVRAEDVDSVPGDGKKYCEVLGGNYALKSRGTHGALIVDDNGSQTGEMLDPTQKFLPIDEYIFGKIEECPDDPSRNGYWIDMAYLTKVTEEK